MSEYLDEVESGGAGPMAQRIPRVVIAKPLAGFGDDATTVPEALDVVITRLDSLWFRLATSHIPLSSPTFHGRRAQFWIDPCLLPAECMSGGGDTEQSPHGPSWLLSVPDDSCGDPRIAVANLEFANWQWSDLLGNPGWKGVKTYPPAKVIDMQIQEQQAGATAISTIMLERGVDHEIVIESVEKSRKRLISLIRPAWSMFWASIICEGLWSPKSGNAAERDDEPSQIDLDNGCAVLDGMGLKNPTRNGFGTAYRKAGYSGSNAKIIRILDHWKKSKP